MSAAIGASALHLEHGTPKSCVITADSGTKSTFYFCGDCGSTPWVEWPGRPALKILEAGLLDGEDVMETEEVKPNAEQYVVRRPN